MKSFKKRGGLTHFQILSEISKQNPYLKQKDLADSLEISIQAVSDNIKTLTDEGYITSNNGRAPYKITQKGIAKVKKDAIALKNYTDEVFETMNNFKTTWPAIAKVDLKEGNIVGLYMEDGLLYADLNESNATGVVISDTRAYEDVALTELKGTIELKIGEVVIITVPPIRKGGSKSADLDLIKRIYEKGTRNNDKFNKVAVSGTVSYVVANKLNLNIDITYAAPQATVYATKKGLNVFVLCVGEMNKSFIRVLEEEEIIYSIFDGCI